MHEEDRIENKILDNIKFVCVILVRQAYGILSFASTNPL